MSWKSYAAVSGATVLAGWLASAPPYNAPAGAPPASRRQSTSPAAVAPSDIEQQAMRLQARLQPERLYTEPDRNPFRFGQTQRVTGPPPSLAPPEPAPPLPVDLAPAGPVVSLSGIAEDQVEGRLERTAILSSPAGVLLVREGEEILGYYRVGRIESEAVELIAISDGSTRRLTFGH